MNYTMDEAAFVMRIGRTKLQTLIQSHPYYYMNGICKLFTQEDIDKLIEAMREEGKARRSPIRHIDPVLSLSHDKAYKRLMKLLNEPGSSRKSRQ